MNVAAGKEVSIEYTLKLKDDSLVATNVGRDPLVYIHGSSQIISGLEQELAGMSAGESKKVTLPPGRRPRGAGALIIENIVRTP